MLGVISRLAWGCGITSLILFSFARCDSGRAERVSVFAAASLTEAFREVGAHFQRQRPEIGVEFQFSGSQLLRTQIEQGAPADVFASANEIHMSALSRQGLVDEAHGFAHNHIVPIVPAGSDKVNSLAELVRPGTRIVMAAEAVPAGNYSRVLLRRISRSPAPADFVRFVLSAPAREILSRYGFDVF